MNERTYRAVMDYKYSRAYPQSTYTAYRAWQYDHQPSAEEHPWLMPLQDSPGSHVEGEVEGFSVQVMVHRDDDTKLGWDDVTGHFTDQYAPGCVKNTRRDWATDYQWYHPSEHTLTHEAHWLRQNGMSKGVVEDTMIELVRLEMKEDASRQYYGVVVTVSYDGEEIASTALWGIDGTDGYDVRHYLRDTASELISEAVDSAQDELPKLLAKAEAHAAALRARVRQTV